MAEKQKRELDPESIGLLVSELLSKPRHEATLLRMNLASDDQKSAVANTEFTKGYHFAIRTVYSALKLINIKDEKQIEGFKKGIESYLTDLYKQSI